MSSTGQSPSSPHTSATRWMPSNPLKRTRRGSAISLPVQPDLLHARVVVVVVVRDEVLHVGPAGEVAQAPAQHRLDRLRLEPALDVQHEGQALLRIDLL